MNSKLTTFLAKLYQVCKQLVSGYIDPYLRLAGINYKDSRIMYITNNRGDIMEKPIMTILQDRNFIEAFSNSDLTQLGYVYVTTQPPIKYSVLAG